MKCVTRIVVGLVFWSAAMSAHGQLVVNSALGELALGSSTNLSGTTVGANRNADVYPDVFVDESLGEVVYEFSLAEPGLLGVINNEGFFVGTDHDHFLLDGLVVTDVPLDDGSIVKVAENSIGFVDEEGFIGGYEAGTYYLSVDTYGLDGNVDGPFDINFTVDAIPAPPESEYLGVAGTDEDVIDINSFGSVYDSELALFNGLSTLLETNDDANADTLLSQIVGGFGPGTYYVALGGYDSDFASGFLELAGSENGDYVLNVNGLSSTGTLAANEIKWFSFDVVPVPEPSSFAPLLLGIALLSRIRRR